MAGDGVILAEFTLDSRKGPPLQNFGLHKRGSPGRSDRAEMRGFSERRRRCFTREDTDFWIVEDVDPYGDGWKLFSSGIWLHLR